MTQIAILSDTHLTQCPAPFVDLILKNLKDVDFILHAGDVTGEQVLDFLSTVAKVYAVRGNMDDSGPTRLLPEKRIIEIDNHRIGLTHGWGAPGDLHRRVRQVFTTDNVSVIAYGHSHHPDIRLFRQCLMINPGSPTDKRFAPYRSFARLILGKNRVHPEIIRLGD